MIPINVAFLWHQHQPFYYSREKGQFLLPWVRLHATKDYLEMAQHLAEHPDMRATINLVPSLLEQLQLYAEGAMDVLQEACRKPVNTLADKERHLITRECFHADRNRMIARSHRFLELVEKQAFDHSEWSEQEIRDLIVLYHLAWTGEFERQKELLTELIAQDRDYSEEQKDLLFQTQDLILRKVVPQHKQLLESGQVELSTTPLYHPILPLLCDLSSAREALPHIALPHRAIGNRRRAHAHVAGAVERHEALFGQAPNGMWPSEGSISDAALEIMMDHGIRWTASDEAVLFNSINHRANADLEKRYGALDKYFPRMIERKGKSIVVFFRDHTLSDKIGFDYQKMSAQDAVNDLIGNIERIRHDIVHQFGKDALASACISIILDGENCWEYYEKNGFEFLDTLYASLGANPHIRPITFSSYLETVSAEKIQPLHHVVAGSWIHGDFRIWVGHPEKNRAWDLLADVWNVDGEPGDSLSSALACAEGSDWFWWYGDDHASGQKPMFDKLFREHVRAAYREQKASIPAALDTPIPEQVGSAGTRASEFGSMHRAGT